MLGNDDDIFTIKHPVCASSFRDNGATVYGL